MIALILGVLGVGGGAFGIALRLFGWSGTLRKLTGFGRGAKRVGKRIPPKVWLALAIAAALVIGFFVHQHHAHKALKAADQAGYDRAKAEDRAAAQAMARRARTTEATGRQITQKVEANHEKAVAAVHSDARDLRLRAPPRIGDLRITGGSLPGLPDASGRGNGPAQGAISGLAQIPWVPLVDHGELCDVDRAKLRTLQDWITLESGLFSGKEKPRGD